MRALMVIRDHVRAITFTTFEYGSTTRGRRYTTPLPQKELVTVTNRSRTVIKFSLLAIVATLLSMPQPAQAVSRTDSALANVPGLYAASVGVENSSDDSSAMITNQTQTNVKIPKSVVNPARCAFSAC